MLIEPRIAAWIKAGIALYVAHPLMIEQVFYDGSLSGEPTFLADGLLEDDTKLWLPGEFAPTETGSGFVRWGADSFPIVTNTETQLTVVGDPNLTTPIDPFAYQIVPPAVAGLTTLLQSQPLVVLTEFAQVPAKMPSITVRLERDAQGETWMGEELRHYSLNGTQVDLRQQAMVGHYLLSLWAINRESTLWLYAWLQNWCLNSMPRFSSWGLYDVAFSGSDLDPALQYMPERTYARHLLLTATRLERAALVQELAWVSSLCIKIQAEYARIDTTILPALD
jgi:hypothetical protein